MKIATYNVNSIGARLPVLLHFEANPDEAAEQSRGPRFHFRKEIHGLIRTASKSPGATRMVALPGPASD
jgi:hypothetical protein